MLPSRFHGNRCRDCLQSPHGNRNSCQVKRKTSDLISSMNSLRMHVCILCVCLCVCVRERTSECVPTTWKVILLNLTMLLYLAHILQEGHRLIVNSTHTGHRTRAYTHANFYFYTSEDLHWCNVVLGTNVWVSFLTQCLCYLFEE